MEQGDVKNIEVDVQEAEVVKTPASRMDDYNNRLGRLIKLTEKQKDRLKAWLKERLSEWERDTSDLHQNLEMDNDLVEGVIYETGWPWDDAFETHIPLTETYMEIYKSIEKRSILGADTIGYAETTEEDPTVLDLLAEIDTMLNFKIKNEWNVENALKQVFWSTNRDGLGALEITWEEEYRPARDILVLTSVEDFLREFPNPEDAGLEEEEWFELGQEVEQEASDEFPVEVPISFEKRTYYGCKANVIELVNFVTIPATVPDIRDELCRGYGKRYTIRSGTIRKMISKGQVYKDEALALLKGGNNYEVSSYVRAQDENEGLRRSNNKDNFELFQLAVRGRLNGDDEVEGDDSYEDECEFQVLYNKRSDKLLACIEFPYRVPNYALFRIDSRPNRLVGKSIPSKTRTLNEEIDFQHAQRINSRTISTIPVFKALLDKKDEIDGMLMEQRWKPGRVFWLKDFNSFDQFKIQPTDLGESMSEEKNNQAILDLYLGSAAALLSGGAPTQDPNAPGNKTAMMIAQSNLRMDDPLDELREGVEQTLNICLSHLYQFGSPSITYRAQDEQGRFSQTKTIHKKFLRRGINMKMSGISVILNPEFEMQNAIRIHQLLMSEPLYASNDQLRVEGLKSALRAGRVPNRHRLLPPVEKIKEMQVQVQTEALKNLEQEKMMAAKLAEQKQMGDRLAKAKQELDIRRTSRHLAEQNLGEPPAPAANGTLPPNIQLNGAPQ